MRFKSLLPIVIAAALLAGCSDSASQRASSPAEKKSTTVAAVALPTDLFIEQAPAGAKTVAEARAAAKQGESIVLTGYIGGRVEPFTAGRAMFLLADLKETPACVDAHGCKTPWDACCEPNERIAANTATVQIVDAAGAPLKLGVNGISGLKPGAVVTVAGTVRVKEDAVMVVDAKTVSVAK